MQPFPPSSNLRCQVTNHLHPHHIRTLEDCFHPLLSSESTKEGRKGHQQKGFPLESGAFSWNSIRILPCNDGYPPGNDHISPKNGILKMIFLFPRWDMLVPWRVVLTCFEVLNSNLKRTKSNTHLAFKKDQNHFEKRPSTNGHFLPKNFSTERSLNSTFKLPEFSPCCFPALEKLGFLRPMKFNQHSGAAHMNLKSKMLSACVFIRVLTWHGLYGFTRKRGWEPTTLSWVIEEKTHWGGRITNMLSQKVM